MGNLDYKGMASTTFRLVIFAFIVGTVLLIYGKITSDNWTTGVLGLVASYASKEAIKSVAEAYRDKGTP